MRSVYISKRAILVILFTLLSRYNFAQGTLPDNMGQPLTTKIYVDIEGSPFLLNDWVKGIVKLSNGEAYKDVLIKYNEVEDILYFKNEHDEELRFVDPVKEFVLPEMKNGTLKQRHFRNGYITGINTKAFYEILVDGTVQLLKRNTKLIQEDKEYNSATATRRFVEDVKYYIVVSDKMNLIKKDKKSILPVLANKQMELEAFIKSNSLNLKNDEDMAKVVRFYNSL